MSNGAHDSGGGLGRSASANAFRGIAVIAAAILVGVLLLNRGVSDEGIATAAGGDDEETATTTTEPEEEPVDPAEATTETTAATGDDAAQPEITTTTATPEVRPPAEVRVLVLNGSGRQGEASRGAATFTEAGYETATPKNAPQPGPSAIYYAEGYAQEASAVATTLGLDPALVVRPLDPAAPPIDDIQGAHLIVMAGNDGLIQF